MLRVRLKADGRIVEVLPDGSERAMTRSLTPSLTLAAPGDGGGAAVAPNGNGQSAEDAAAYARRIRGATHLSQNDFAARIGVPVETVRNWEQGKRMPRGPARALLKIIDRAPETAFALLDTRKTAH